MREISAVFVFLVFVFAPTFLGDARADLSEARSIVEKGLNENIVRVSVGGREREYVTAGGYQYRNLWARDFSMSVPGLIAMKREGAVRDTLDAFFDHQRADGQLPRLLDSMSFQLRVVFGIFGFRRPLGADLEPNFETENSVPTIDTRLMLSLAALNYAELAHDEAWLKQRWPAIRLALSSLEGEYGEDGLLGRQPPFSDWADSVARTGKVGFTNALYAVALERLARAAKRVANGVGEVDAVKGVGEADVASFDAAARGVRDRFRRVFYDSAKGVLRNTDHDDRLSADVNYFTISNGLLSREEGARALEVLRSTPLLNGFSGRATWPDYDRTQKSFFVKLAGISEYHDSMVWLWLSAAAADAYRAVGDAGRCQQELDRIVDLVLREREVSEVYENEGKNGTTGSIRGHDMRSSGSGSVGSSSARLRVVSRLLYRSESPFTWSSAMIESLLVRGCEFSERGEPRDVGTDVSSGAETARDVLLSSLRRRITQFVTRMSH